MLVRLRPGWRHVPRLLRQRWCVLSARCRRRRGRLRQRSARLLVEPLLHSSTRVLALATALARAAATALADALSTATVAAAFLATSLGTDPTVAVAAAASSDSSAAATIAVATVAVRAHAVADALSTAVSTAAATAVSAATPTQSSAVWRDASRTLAHCRHRLSRLQRRPPRLSPQHVLDERDNRHGRASPRRRRPACMRQRAWHVRRRLPDAAVGRQRHARRLQHDDAVVRRRAWREHARRGHARSRVRRRGAHVLVPEQLLLPPRRPWLQPSRLLLRLWHAQLLFHERGALQLRVPRRREGRVRGRRRRVGLHRRRPRARPRRSPPRARGRGRSGYPRLARRPPLRDGRLPHRAAADRFELQVNDDPRAGRPVC